jgi:hypothetical protein
VINKFCTTEKLRRLRINKVLIVAEFTFFESKESSIILPENSFLFNFFAQSTDKSQRGLKGKEKIFMK